MYPTLNIAESAYAIQQGKVLAYPTEAVWGLGCDPFNAAAVSRLLALKHRPVDKGLILLAANTSQLKPYVDLNDKDLESLADTDQTTTFLVPYHTDNIPPWIVGSHPLLAVRVSHHKTVSALCTALDGVLVSTSANTAGSLPAKEIFQLRHYFDNRIDVCRGRVGGDKKPSKIINFLTGQSVRI